MARLLAWLLLCSVANAAMPYDAVCRVDLGDKGHGSGILVAVDNELGLGLVVTNAHVVAFDAFPKLVWKSETQRGWVVTYRPDDDLALVVLRKPNVQPVRVGMRDSEGIIFCGYPHYDKQKLHWQYGHKVVDQNNGRTRWFRPPVPGMSGGGVFDRADGDLCGVVSWCKGEYGGGVDDLTLFMLVRDYRDPTTWVANSDYLKDVKKTDWSYAPKKNKVVTAPVDTVEPPELGYEE